jgi:hypothetical protein
MNPAIPRSPWEGSEQPREGVLHGFHATGVTIEPELTEHVGEGFAVRASGEYVPVGDRLVPSMVELELNGDATSPTSTVRVEVRDGAPRVVEMRFHAKPGQGEVRQAHLRETQLEAMVELVAAFAVRVVSFDDGTGVVQSSLSPEGEVWSESLDSLRRARANRKVTPELLQEVAAVYREHLATGPTKAVRARFFVSQRMASNYVQRARRAGLLPPTSPGKKRA